MDDSALYRSLDAVAAPLRGMRGLARALAGAAVALTLLALAAWSVRIGWAEAPGWIVGLWILVAAIVVISGAAARIAIARLGPWRIGRDLEASGNWRRGALTTVLEHRAVGTSSALHAAALAARAQEVAMRGGSALSPAMERARRSSRRAGACALLACAALVAARPATGAPSRIWHPLGAVRALVAPVRLSARDSSVARGAQARFDLTAIGRRHATLYTRAPGEAWQATEVQLDQDGNASFVSAPLTADLLARLEAGGRASAEVRVSVRLAAFLGAFTATAHYPPYLGMDDESLPTTGDTLVLPEGTRLSLAGRATTPLLRARLRGPAGDDDLAVSGAAFRGELVPPQSGAWRLSVEAAGGAVLESEMPELPIRVVTDSAPAVEIPVPGADTVATASMTLALVVGIRDDHGIVSAALETRRGTGGVAARAALPLAASTTDRALLITTIDLAALGLKPGDTLRYVATATDNAPTHHVGRSREFVVRIPTEAEQRAARAQLTGETQANLDSLSRQIARAQRTAEDLSRERQRSDLKDPSRAGDDAQKQPLASDAARQAQAAADAQQKLMDAAAKTQRAVQELQKAAAREGPADSALARELNEVNRLLDQALSPELRAKLAELQQALRNLDADRTHDALQDIAKQQADLKQAMDQARDLFKRAALETDLANLGKEAKALAAEQHALTPDLGHADSGKAAAKEEQLAKRADSLAAALDHAADKVPAEMTRQGFHQNGQQAGDASRKMRDAATSSKEGKTGQSQSEAKQAEEQLNPLSKKIDDNRQAMQAEMRAEVKQALEGALEETARLAQQQLKVVNALQDGALLPATRADEAMVEEGAAKVAQQLVAVAAMNALVSPQAGVAVAEARRLMREAIDAVASVNPNPHDADEKAGDAVDALAVAAFSLLQSKDRIDGSQSGSGVQEAMEQMKQMAGKQSQLAQQGAGMMQQGQGTAQQLMQMAMQQRAVAQQLERMRAAGQLPGAGQMAREAKELSQSLEAGRLNQAVVDRQQHLFKRMLDAGRTLQGQEDDDKKERQSTVATDRPPAVPPALDARIRNGTDEIRLPNWESMQRLSPEERRRVVDYFQRLAQAAKP